MIASFLKGEIASDRFGWTLDALLKRDGRDRRVLEEPDLTREADNRYRRSLLGEFRGYGQDRELFEFFPDDVTWHRYRISRSELARVYYVDYSYWNELSEGSRRAVDGARGVRQGKVVFGQSGSRFWNAVEALKRGVRFPELIMVGRSVESDLVLLEGHLRLTAYMLAPEFVPHSLTAIVGVSPQMGRWMALPSEEV